MGKRMLLLTQQFFFLGGPRPSTKARHAPNMAFTHCISCSGCQTFAVGRRPATSHQRGVCVARLAPNTAVRRLRRTNTFNPPP